MNSTPRRVLIVEDSPAMRQLLTLAMKRFPDIAIDHAADGVAALRVLQSAEHGPYHLVLLDLNMPLMDGMKFLAKIRELGISDTTTICVVTTEESEETELRAKALGAKYFIRKPVNRRIVENVLHEVFGPPLS